MNQGTTKNFLLQYCRIFSTVQWVLMVPVFPRRILPKDGPAPLPPNGIPSYHQRTHIRCLLPIFDVFFCPTGLFLPTSATVHSFRQSKPPATSLVYSSALVGCGFPFWPVTYRQDGYQDRKLLLETTCWPRKWSMAPLLFPGVLSIFFTFAENISASWRNHLGMRVDNGSKTGASCRPRKFFLEFVIFSGLSLRWLTGSGAWSKFVGRGSGQGFLSLSQMNFLFLESWSFFSTFFAFAGNWRNYLGMGVGHGSKTGAKNSRLASYVFIHCRIPKKLNAGHIAHLHPPFLWAAQSQYYIFW